MSRSCGDTYRAFEHIRDDIVRVRLVPGQPLSVTDLSEQLKVAHKHVRAALLRLSWEGLVDIGGRNKTHVARVRRHEILTDLYMIEALEAHVFGRLLNATKESLTSLSECIAAQYAALRCGDLDRLWNALADFEYRACHLSNREDFSKEITLERVQYGRIAYIGLSRNANRLVAENTSMAVTLGTADERVLALELEKRSQNRRADVNHTLESYPVLLERDTASGQGFD